MVTPVWLTTHNTILAFYYFQYVTKSKVLSQNELILYDRSASVTQCSAKGKELNKQQAKTTPERCHVTRCASQKEVMFLTHLLNTAFMYLTRCFSVSSLPATWVTRTIFHSSSPIISGCLDDVITHMLWMTQTNCD